MRLIPLPIQAALAKTARSVPTLPTFRRQSSQMERIIRYGSFALFCVTLGLVYGFFYTILPPQLLLYLLMPIALLAGLVIWAMPDVGRAPVRLLARLLLIYFTVTLLWPNYLAIVIPGLPWLTLRRVVIIPMTIILLICYSTSSQFRRETMEILRASKPLSYLIGAFTAVQFATTFLSEDPAFSFNVNLNFWLQATTPFFVAAWALSRQRYMQAAVWGIVVTATILTIMAILEYNNRGVLWANHIPSFLRVQDELMERYLSGRIRDLEYRAAATFSVSLSLAEYLAIATPFFIHKMVKSVGINKIALWGVGNLALLLAINLTQSRLGVVGWITAHAIYLGVWAFRRWSVQRTDILAPAISLVYPSAVVLFIIGMFTVPAVRNRTIGGGSTGLSDEARQVQFDMMWPHLFANPFGYGAGRSGEVLQYRLPSGLLTVDSYVITTVLDYGVIGLFLFSGMLIYAAVKLLQLSWKHENGELSLSLPLACSMVIIIQVRLILSQIDNLPLIFMMLGATAAIIFKARKADRERLSKGLPQK
jgi:hypothetical protein